MSMLQWHPTTQHLLWASSQRLAGGPDCCCNNLCCPVRPADTLYATLSDITDCSCIDLVEFTLVWDEVGDYWEGGPTGSGCAIIDEVFRLLCDNTRDANDCFRYKLILVGGTSCIADPVYPDDCSCDPFWAQFTMAVNGLSCCNDSFSGSGTIGVYITETPP